MMKILTCLTIMTILLGTAVTLAAANPNLPTETTSATATRTARSSIYFAAPLFSQSERDYNLFLTKILENHGYTVFLPQRDGFLASELENKTETEMVEMIFNKDVSAILKASWYWTDEFQMREHVSNLVSLMLIRKGATG